METLAAMLPPSKLAFTKRLCEFYLCSKYCVRAQLFVLTLWACCVFHVFGCALSVYHLSSHWVRVCLLLVYVVIEHMVNSKWFQISTSWTQKYPEHTLAPICWAVTHGFPPKNGRIMPLCFFFIPVMLSKLLTKPSQYRWFDKLWGPSDVIVILHIFIPYLFISSVRPITTSHATRGKPMNRETWRSPHGH